MDGRVNSTFPETLFVAKSYSFPGLGRAVKSLAPLPTQSSESSELYALGDLFKVRLPLPISGRV